MRLVLSGLQDFNPHDSNVRLLGPWCLQKTQAPIPLESLIGFKVPDRPMESTSPKAADDITKAVTLCIPALAESLNRYHGRQYSNDFWNIILRHSVAGLAVLLYDRFCHIQKALKTGENFEVEIFPENASLQLPTRFATLIWGEQPVFNHYLYSELIHFLKPENVKIRSLKTDHPLVVNFHDNSFKGSNIKLTLRQRLGRARRKLLAQWELWVREQGYRRGFATRGIPYLEFKDLRKLINELKKIKTSVVNQKINYVPKTAPSQTDRIVLNLISNDVFLKFMERMIPKLLPTFMTTDFSEWEKEGLSKLDSRVQVCIWGPNFSDNWPDRMELALYKEFNKAICIGTQHGTGYGTFRYTPDPFQTEYKTFDEFITWGWTAHEGFNFKTKPLPQPMFVKIEGTHKANSDDIVFVGTLATGTVYYSLPLVHVDECYNYFEMKKRFLNLLNPERFKEILYRPYFSGTAFIDELKFLKDNFSSTRIQEGALWPALQTCKLAVLDHPGSTLHVVASMNTPFILFNDPHLFPLGKDMDRFIELFKKAGIYHETAESAARQVNEIGSDVQKWWSRPEVRQARNEFIKFHALTAPNWPQIWARFIADRLNP